MSLEIVDQFHQLTFTVQSDGVATVITQDLSLEPYSLSFHRLPDHVVVTVGDESATGTGTLILDAISGHPILTVTLSAPLPAGTDLNGIQFNINVTFEYAGTV